VGADPRSGESFAGSASTIPHTYAALMLRQGKSLEYVSQQLGHTKIDVTIRSTHTSSRA